MRALAKKYLASQCALLATAHLFSLLFQNNVCVNSTNEGKQGIIYPTGTETFAKEPKFAKIIPGAKVSAPAVSVKRPTGFCHMFVTASLLFLGALLQDNLQMGAFSWRRCTLPRA